MIAILFVTGKQGLNQGRINVKYYKSLKITIKAYILIDKNTNFNLQLDVKLHSKRRP